MGKVVMIHTVVTKLSHLCEFTESSAGNMRHRYTSHHEKRDGLTHLVGLKLEDPIDRLLDVHRSTKDLISETAEAACLVLRFFVFRFERSVRFGDLYGTTYALLYHCLCGSNIQNRNIPLLIPVPLRA